MTTPADSVLGPLLATDPAAPLVTHYGLDTGSRVELSAVTTANWAAKVAGLLRDELGVAPGDVVAVDVPGHWLVAGVLLGAWWCGAEVRTVGGDTGRTADDAAVLVTGADRLDGHPTDVETLVMTTHPMGLPERDLPPGVADIAESCRVHPDAFSPAPGPAAPALDGAPLADLADPGLAGRVLLADPAGAVDALARVLASGGSAVLVTGLPHAEDASGARDDDDGDATRAELERVAAVERVTVRR